MPIVLLPPEIGFGQGSPEHQLRGSGFAVPTGVIGTVFEYNGLLLNNRNDYDAYVVEEIDGIYDSDMSTSSEPNPGYHGETPGESLYRGKTITISGHIRAYHWQKLDDMKQALRAAFNNVRVEQPLIFRTGNFDHDHLIFCKKNSALGLKNTVPDVTKLPLKEPFMITLRASNFRFLSFQQKQQTLMLQGGGTMEIENLGNFPAQPRILLQGPMSDVHIHGAPQSYAPDSHVHFVIEGAIPAGRYYEIDVAKRTMKDDLGSTDVFDQLTIESEWSEIDPGVQAISVEATGITAASAVTFIWRDTWH